MLFEDYKFNCKKNNSVLQCRVLSLHRQEFYIFPVCLFNAFNEIAIVSIFSVVSILSKPFFSFLAALQSSLASVNLRDPNLYFVCF